jgi:aryl-alcohol dehydrogenase-like predicted oxidoreductase
MVYRRLGRTDIEVSTICLGCWALIGDSTWGPQDPRQSQATVHAALDAGINFFDTAPGYGDGESESLLGAALADVRKHAVIATKVSYGQLAPDDVVKSCDRSLALLKTDVIDLLQVHWPHPDIALADTLGAFRRLQEAGKIRAIGVSNFGAGYLSELLAVARAETNQLCYSLLWRAIEHEVQPVCVKNDIGILCYSPLCQGLLTGKFTSADHVPHGRARTRLFSKDRPQSRHHGSGCEAETFKALRQIRGIAESVRQPMGQVALAWLLSRPGVISVIAGARSPEQVRQNALAAEVTLTSDVLNELSEVTEDVKASIGANADMWQTDSRMER